MHTQDTCVQKMSSHTHTHTHLNQAKDTVDRRTLLKVPCHVRHSFPVPFPHYPSSCSLYPASTTQSPSCDGDIMSHSSLQATCRQGLSCLRSAIPWLPAVLHTQRASNHAGWMGGRKEGGLLVVGSPKSSPGLILDFLNCL